MGKSYFYNTKTHMLHICGYCRESEQVLSHVRYFDSLDEAVAFAGSGAKRCKLCIRKEREIDKRPAGIWGNKAGFGD